MRNCHAITFDAAYAFVGTPGCPNPLVRGFSVHRCPAGSGRLPSVSVVVGLWVSALASPSPDFPPMYPPAAAKVTPSILARAPRRVIVDDAIDPAVATAAAPRATDPSAAPHCFTATSGGPSGGLSPGPFASLNLSQVPNLWAPPTPRTKLGTRSAKLAALRSSLRSGDSGSSLVATKFPYQHAYRASLACDC